MHTRRENGRAHWYAVSAGWLARARALVAAPETTCVPVLDLREELVNARSDGFGMDTDYACRAVGPHTQPFDLLLEATSGMLRARMRAHLLLLFKGQTPALDAKDRAELAGAVAALEKLVASLAPGKGTAS